MMISLGVILLTGGACGSNISSVVNGTNGSNGTNCSAKVVNGQKEVTCSDGTSFPVYDGINGVQGAQGYGTGVTTSQASANECANGGTDMAFFKDVYNNGVFQAGDTVTSHVAVCNGLNGSNGTNGSSSSIVVSNANNLQCANGGLVLTTQNGVQSSTNTVCNGATGATGATGPQGSAGLNAASVTPVQFCSGTSSYPNTFLEYGLCINNQLYAVYSANDGFLALISPGYYNSNAIGSNCNFTVGANCAIGR